MKCTCATLLSLAYPAVQYFSTLSHKRHDFLEETYRTWHVFHIIYSLCLKRFTLNDQRCTLVFMWSARYSCQILVETWFFQEIFEKNQSNIKFHENPSVRAEMFHTDGRTDRYNETNSRFSQFCDRAKWLMLYLWRWNSARGRVEGIDCRLRAAADLCGSD
jgi:hypothetical protein